MEGLERPAKARRSNHVVCTSLEAMQEREQREKVERRCATFAFGARRAASPRCAATSGLGEISNFPFHFASSLGVMLLGISIESMIHIPHVHPHLDTPCTMEFGSRHEYEHKVSIDINHDLKS